MEYLQQKINLLEGGITGTPLDEDDITQTMQELVSSALITGNIFCMTFWAKIWRPIIPNPPTFCCWALPT